MTTLLAPNETAASLKAGKQLSPAEFAVVRRRMVLDSCKWDPQVGDVATLAPFPLLVRRSTWLQLVAWAEALAREAIDAERELIARPELHRRLGLPRRIRHLLKNAAQVPDVPRVMRFDFHWTRDGWRISECNADVPGGFSEASCLPRLMCEHYDDVAPAGDPGGAWAEAIASVADRVAMISTPGFMEDHQVVSYLAARLRQRGIVATCAQPLQLEWLGRRASLGGEPFDAIVRFYQAEWLAKLPPAAHRERYFIDSQTRALNPGTAVLIESKRFPLVWDELRSTSMRTWRRLLPETRDPRDAPWQRDADWLLKSALCNTGDTVSIRQMLPAKAWASASRAARWFPAGWIAQRRFESVPLDSPAGLVHTCIGAYTVNGRACGIYGRLSRTPVIDYSAIDVAVLIVNADEHAAEQGGVEVA